MAVDGGGGAGVFEDDVGVAGGVPGEGDVGRSAAGGRF